MEWWPQAIRDEKRSRAISQGGKARHSIAGSEVLGLSYRVRACAFG